MLFVKKVTRKNILWEAACFSLLFLFLYLPSAVAKDTTNTNSNQNGNNNANLGANGNGNVSVAPNTQNKQEEINKKQQQLDSVRQQVNKFEKKSGILEGKSDTIKKMLDLLDQDIQEAEESLKKTAVELAASEKSINEKEHQIVLKEDEIDKRRSVLEGYVRKLNLLDQKTFLEIILEKPRISEYFQEIESIVAFEQRVKEMIAGLSEKRTDLVRERDSLEESKGEQLALYVMQEEQRITLENDKRDREELLANTQQEQSEVQNLIGKGTEVASRLVAELTALQSLGDKIDFGQALQEAKTVSGLTGVRTALLLGVLKIESNMGTNVGGGKYKTDMNPAQWDRFKSICSELGYDPAERPVSRKPCYKDSSGKCGGWGGAMGPAQFMPSVWMGYKESVAKVTGHNPPSPWDLRDALTAMGLKLAKVDGVIAHDRKSEHKAASIYLAGGNWERFSWYGDRVLRFAEMYEDKMKEMGQ